VTLYLDTSSLVKLYVAEPGSAEVRRLVDAAAVVATVAIAYTEARSAFARRRREGSLKPGAYRAARQAFDADWSRLLTVAVTSDLCREAGDLAERYRLRAYDSIHLAAYGQLVRAADDRAEFSSYDESLNRAARAFRKAVTETAQ
jgi:predicted nucleic acid-binding protein